MRQRVNETLWRQSVKEIAFWYQRTAMAFGCCPLATVREWDGQELAMDVKHSETSGNQHSIGSRVRFTFLWLTWCSDIAYQQVRITMASNTTSSILKHWWGWLRNDGWTYYPQSVLEWNGKVAYPGLACQWDLDSYLHYNHRNDRGADGRKAKAACKRLRQKCYGERKKQKEVRGEMKMRNQNLPTRLGRASVIGRENYKMCSCWKAEVKWKIMYLTGHEK